MSHNFHRLVPALVLTLLDDQSRRQAKQIAEYVYRNIDRAIRPIELARLVKRSPAHFSRQFRAMTTVTPSEYILLSRIGIAKKYLAETDMPLAEIAVATGFSSQSHFTTAFRRVEKTTPAKWRAAATPQD